MPNTGVSKSLESRPINYFVFSAETEVWQFPNGNNKIINPTLGTNTYRIGIGIYPVDFDYCRKN